MSERSAPESRPALSGASVIRTLIETEATEVPFASTPMMKALNAVFIRGQQGSVRFRFTVPEQGRQGDGLIHGGIVATMLDCAMSMAALSVLSPEETIASINLNINFMRPGIANHCEAEGQIDKVGRSVLFARSSIYSDQGKCLATAISTFARIRSTAD
ncbi:PaaI family thioesterase [Novosphingobium aquimarinum]|uniref:PaaI family thioesterase n=1 Tax=Novosphingobium aquimarinum TaxID=2682494 RepID=UPI0018DC78B9|nr:PaaI family thioesterase [Novosphingobium aquimarinum]